MSEMNVKIIQERIDAVEDANGTLRHWSKGVDEMFDNFIALGFPLGLSDKEKRIAKLVLRSRFNEMLDYLRR